ncbi:MAG: hypothetical protein JXB88_12280 [Spirochaetales bacterium]|nr:hypothetical protein [Spirochaetales bacterium]
MAMPTTQNKKSRKYSMTCNFITLRARTTNIPFLSLIVEYPGKKWNFIHFLEFSLYFINEAKHK